MFIYRYVVYIAENYTGDRRSQIFETIPTSPTTTTKTTTTTTSPTTTTTTTNATNATTSTMTMTTTTLTTTITTTSTTTEASILPGEYPAGTNLINIPPGTSRGDYTYFVVYTKSTLFEQTTPAFMSFTEVTDTYRVTDVLFIDDDPDPADLAGDVQWVPPAVNDSITQFNIYLAEDEGGTNRQQLASIPLGTNSYFIPLETPKLDHEWILIHSANNVSEQRTPAVPNIYIYIYI